MPASDAWRPAVGFASCVAMRSVFRTIGAGAPNKFPGSRVAQAERWRSVAAASAVVERREASAPQGARRAARARRLLNSAFRRSAFLFVIARSVCDEAIQTLCRRPWIASSLRSSQ